jgi:hypothetical protein
MFIVIVIVVVIVVADLLSEKKLKDVKGNC